MGPARGIANPRQSIHIISKSQAKRRLVLIYFDLKPQRFFTLGGKILTKSKFSSQNLKQKAESDFDFMVLARKYRGIANPRQSIPIISKSQAKIVNLVRSCIVFDLKQSKI